MICFHLYSVLYSIEKINCLLLSIDFSSCSAAYLSLHLALRSKFPITNQYKLIIV